MFELTAAQKHVLALHWQLEFLSTGIPGSKLLELVFSSRTPPRMELHGMKSIEAYRVIPGVFKVEEQAVRLHSIRERELLDEMVAGLNRKLQSLEQP